MGFIARITFDEYRQQVNTEVLSLLGVELADLPGVGNDMTETWQQFTPRQMAERIASESQSAV